jgi:hypothetical protein
MFVRGIIQVSLALLLHEIFVHCTITYIECFYVMKNLFGTHWPRARADVVSRRMPYR